MYGAPDSANSAMVLMSNGYYNDLHDLWKTEPITLSVYGSFQVFRGRIEKWDITYSPLMIRSSRPSAMVIQVPDNPYEPGNPKVHKIECPVDV